MPKLVGINEFGRRVGEDHPGARLTDADVEELIRCYVKAARVARDCGADFVDIKHCHGYLLHEFLGAHTRPGKFGGSFENRTRILRDIIAGIRADGNAIDTTEFFGKETSVWVTAKRKNEARTVAAALGIKKIHVFKKQAKDDPSLVVVVGTKFSDPKELKIKKAPSSSLYGPKDGRAADETDCSPA